MIKIDDLMKGDWVSVNGLPARVVELMQSSNLPMICVRISGNLFDFSEEEVSPIPLSEELLEKNRFMERIYTDPDNNESYIYYEWIPTDEKYKRKCIMLWSNNEGGYSYGDTLGDIVITSLHELQHLMKLCKVKVEIKS